MITIEKFDEFVEKLKEESIYVYGKEGKVSKCKVILVPDLNKLVEEFKDEN